MSNVILNEWLYPFIARIISIHRSGVLVALFGCCMAGATWTAATSVQVLCTSFNHAPVYSHFVHKWTTSFNNLQILASVKYHAVPHPVTYSSHSPKSAEPFSENFATSWRQMVPSNVLYSATETNPNIMNIFHIFCFGCYGWLVLHKRFQ